jgi:hypothetical protein
MGGPLGCLACSCEVGRQFSISPGNRRAGERASRLPGEPGMLVGRAGGLGRSSRRSWSLEPAVLVARAGGLGRPSRGCWSASRGGRLCRVGGVVPGGCAGSAGLSRAVVPGQRGCPGRLCRVGGVVPGSWGVWTVKMRADAPGLACTRRVGATAARTLRVHGGSADSPGVGLRPTTRRPSRLGTPVSWGSLPLGSRGMPSGLACTRRVGATAGRTLRVHGGSADSPGVGLRPTDRPWRPTVLRRPLLLA